jgi:signal transduction histidine kinase
MRRLLPYWSVIIAVALGLIYTVEHRAQLEYESAREEFIEKSRDSTRLDLQKIQLSLGIIQENIRTLAALPSVRHIDHHGKNLSDEARVTIQQIYNNVASSVSISEVYIVPIDLDPDRVDPVTHRPEVPILKFDELILNAGANLPRADRKAMPGMVKAAPFTGPAEVEIHEYRQMKETATWLKQNYPTTSHIKDGQTPFVSSREVITREDNRLVHTGSDADRSGVIFSTPFYGADGKIRGLISAVMLTSALRDLLPTHHSALINPGNNYFNMGKSVGELGTSRPWIMKGLPDPSLIYSEVIPLPTVDQRNLWHVWSGVSNEVFETGVEVSAINFYRQVSIVVILVIAIAAGLSISTTLHNLAKTHALNDSLRQSRDAANKSEIEAQIATVNLKELNEDITLLNMKLTKQAEELRQAQEDIVRKAKMAQLGSLVATVAHELRNPLGAARTTLFVLNKKLRGAESSVAPQLARIDASILRCDTIITELLDFSRSQKPKTKLVDLDAWLEEVMSEEAAKLPSSLVVSCHLGLRGCMVEFDASRLTRVIINLLSNASEAMLAKGTPFPEMRGRTPQIEVSTSLSSRGAEIAVKDNGPGIPPHMLEKIREPLFTTKGFGVGLGISAIEKVLELHGGGLDIDSIQGQGARFTAWLPLRQKEQQAA